MNLLIFIWIMNLICLENLEKYEDILRKDKGDFFDDYDEVREKVMALEEELKDAIEYLYHLIMILFLKI